MSDLITTEQHGAVLHLGFNRPERKNSITAAMYQTLADALNSAATDNGIRVVLIHGSDQMFSAGNDLEDFLKNPPHGDSSPVFQFLLAISAFPKPLVAAVAGVAVGVGVTMLMHCDLVYVADNAKLSVPFAQVRVVPRSGVELSLANDCGLSKGGGKITLRRALWRARVRGYGLGESRACCTRGSYLCRRTSAEDGCAPSSKFAGN
jgi:enoyl-CoA hydratase/carnithine racemase